MWIKTLAGDFVNLSLAKKVRVTDMRIFAEFAGATTAEIVIETNNTILVREVAAAIHQVLRDGSGVIDITDLAQKFGR